MILKRLILCLSMLLLFVACNRFKGPEKPENLISKDNMINILIDSKLLTSANTANKRIMRDSNLDINTYVFKKYNIDSLQFAESNAYYAYHVEVYDAIYNTAIDSLTRLHEALKAEEAEEWKAQTKKEELESIKKEVSKKNDTLILLKAVDEK